MFAKRPKKVFSPGTFIPRPARIAAILQLCVAFTLILYIASYPFMGALFEHKSKALLYRTVMGDATLANTAPSESAKSYRERLQSNNERFSRLPADQQNPIIEQYDRLASQDSRTFLEKVWKSVHIFLFELPAFELAWITFAIVISIMLLMRIEGAAPAAWLLPVLAACYAGINFWHGITVPESADTKLFPTEEVIVRDYLKSPLSADIGLQQQELMRGWKMYLIQDWAHQQPSPNSVEFEQQAQEGEFYFNLARLEANIKSPTPPKTWFDKESPFILAIYFLWNVFFAWTVSRRRNRVANVVV